MDSTEEKTICTLVQECREIIKYETFEKRNAMQSIESLLEHIQRRALAMEKGLARSKYDVGQAVLHSNDLQNIHSLVKKRWPNLK